MGRTARTIIGLVVFCFLTLVVGPTPGPAHLPSAGDASPVVVTVTGTGNTAVLLAAVTSAVPDTLAPGECYSSPGSPMWPSARFADRNRSRRAGSATGDVLADPVEAVVAQATAPAPARAAQVHGGRLVDLRALCGPHVLRVVRS